mgnify:FL=1
MGMVILYKSNKKSYFLEGENGMTYVECARCKKKLPLDSQAIIRRGFIGYYCSWRCAALESSFFEIVSINKNDIEEDKIETYEL